MIHDISQLGLTSKYCGPYVACAVTGKPWPEVRSALNAARGKADNAGIRGLAQDHLREGLKALGARVTGYLVPNMPGWSVVDGKWKREGLERITLEDFLLAVQPCETWIIVVGNHYIVSYGSMIADNQCGIPLEAERYMTFKRSKGGKWVKWAIRVQQG